MPQEERPQETVHLILTELGGLRSPPH
jgi:hypothetical protein